MRRSVLALTVAQLAGDEDRLLDAMRPAGQANASRASRQADTRAAAAPRYVRIGKPGQWELFEGWRFVHHLEGDPGARRVHIVNRAMPDPLADLRQGEGAHEGIPGVFGVDPVDCRRLLSAPSSERECGA